MRDAPETVHLAYSTGEILFAFLRYLASRQFAYANLIRFRLGGMMEGKKDAPIFTRPEQWSALYVVSSFSLQQASLINELFQIHG